MIVRILGEGQYEIDDAKIADLDKLDDPLGLALESGEADTFADALDVIVTWVREHGAPLDPATFVPSDRVLPAPGSALNEVQALLASEGEGN